MATQTLYRGTIFRAEHDDSYEFWSSDEPRSKLCLVFNSAPVSDGDVHYFLSTSKVAKLRENPSVLSDVLILPAGAYDFFPEETALDFRHLCVAEMSKLLAHRMTIKGTLDDSDIRRCESIAAKARLLEHRAKKLLGLR